MTHFGSPCGRENARGRGGVPVLATISLHHDDTCASWVRLVRPMGPANSATLIANQNDKCGVSIDSRNVRFASKASKVPRCPDRRSIENGPCPRSLRADFPQTASLWRDRPLRGKAMGQSLLGFRIRQKSKLDLHALEHPGRLARRSDRTI